LTSQVVEIQCVFATGVSAAMFKDKEDVPAMSIAALEKKYHCVIEVHDQGQRTAAAARHYRQASHTSRVV